MSRIRNQATVDLRSFSPKALSKIKSITNCAVVYLPENAGEEFYEVYSEIKKMNIAEELYLPADADMNKFNGVNVITKNDIQKNGFVMANGTTVLKDIPEDMNVRILSNGITIIANNVNVNFSECNGIKHTISLSDFPIKMSPSNVIIDTEAIKYFEQNTVVISGGDTKICEDVEVSRLDEKNITIVSSGKLIAPKKMHGYFSAKAIVAGKIIEK